MKNDLKNHFIETGQTESNLIQSLLNEFLQKNSIEEEEEPTISNEPFDPLALMKAIIQDKQVDVLIRSKLLIELAQYVYPKKKKVESFDDRKKTPEQEYEETLELVLAEVESVESIESEVSTERITTTATANFHFLPLEIRLEIKRR
jgi:hypothetical protein